MTFDLFDTLEEPAAAPAPRPEPTMATYACTKRCEIHDAQAPHAKATECGRRGCLYVRMRAGQELPALAPADAWWLAELGLVASLHAPPEPKGKRARGQEGR